MTIFYFFLIFLTIASFGLQFRFRSKARKYSQTALSNGMSGAEIARKMLNDHKIYDVEVIHTQGELTDHYNPANKTVNLSDDVYFGRSTLAAAVAAHECGHAVQHATAYSWLEFRSNMVPAVSIASKYMHWLILAGVLLVNQFGTTLLLIGIILFSLTTLFSFVTLPVEFDASNRAMAWLRSSGMIYGNEEKESRSALNWAASTYVMAAISSLATLVYYVLMFLGRSDD